jgi:hypothetical protein
MWCQSAESYQASTWVVMHLCARLTDQGWCGVHTCTSEYQARGAATFKIFFAIWNCTAGAQCKKAARVCFRSQPPCFTSRAMSSQWPVMADVLDPSAQKYADSAGGQGGRGKHVGLEGGRGGVGDCGAVILHQKPPAMQPTCILTALSPRHGVCPLYIFCTPRD